MGTTTQCAPCVHEKYVIEKLGSLIGKVEDVDTDEMGESKRPIVRAIISVDITKPLKNNSIFF